MSMLKDVFNKMNALLPTVKEADNNVTLEQMAEDFKDVFDYYYGDVTITEAHKTVVEDMIRALSLAGVVSCCLAYSAMKADTSGSEILGSKKNTNTILAIGDKCLEIAMEIEARYNTNVLE